MSDHPTIAEAFRAYPGCDKDTDHSYGAVYDALFPPDRRAAVRAVLGLGLRDEDTLRALAVAFPRATVVGVNRDPAGSVPGGRPWDGRLQGVWYCPEAADARAAARRGLPRGRFDLIIDDDSHAHGDQIRAYDSWRDCLAPGGVYVVEDLQPNRHDPDFAARGLEVLDLRPHRARYDDVVAVAGPADAVARARGVVAPQDRGRKPRVIYHAACMNHWREIVREQAQFAARHDLTGWDVVLLGPPADREECRRLLAGCGVSARVAHESDHLDEYEFPAVRLAQRLAREADDPILYWHTKGASKPGDTHAGRWRKCMTAAVVGLWPYNVARLVSADMVGVNWLGNHFVGNFWLANPEYLRTLTEFDAWEPRCGFGDCRLAAEFWAGHRSPRVVSLVCRDRPWHDGVFGWLCEMTADWFDRD